MGKKHIVLLSNLAIALLFIWLTALHHPIREWAECKGYDAMMALPVTPHVSSPIVLIDMEKQALYPLGACDRSRLGKGIQQAAKNGARVIGLPLLLDTSPDSLSRDALAGLAEAFKTTFGTTEDPKLQAFHQTIEDLQVQLDQDQLLANAIASAGNVILPVVFSPHNNNAAIAPEAAKLFGDRSQRVYGIAQGAAFPRSSHVRLPLPAYLAAAHHVGHLSLLKDSDNTIRKSQPIWWYQNQPVASFALSLAATYLGIPEKDLQMQSNRLSFNGHRIYLSEQSSFFIRFDATSQIFPRYSFSALLSDNIPPGALAEKLVLFNPSIGEPTQGVATPIDSHMRLGELTAHTIRSLLRNTSLHQLAYDNVITFSLIVLAGVVIIFLLPRLNIPKGALLALLIVITLAGASLYFFAFQRIWIQTVFPAAEIMAGFFFTALIAGRTPAPPANRLEKAAGEVQRLQGLAFQSQGQPDAAWNKLRVLPVDNAIKSALYDVAIDFENRSQPDKALKVYEHIEPHDAEYRDIQTRMSRLTLSADTVVMGETDPGTGQTTPDMRGVPTKLGRYELITPIGFGAMGTVYLGQDPRIKRKTAIKTYRFDEEYDPDDAERMRQKFFREAESAGKLSHPGIVTIYDAGEQDGLAYIAMEFLEGNDLRSHIKPETLLPKRKVIGYTADLAEALSYAHSHGVVHRDIKPANIMLINTGAVKITDFGIARIIATSKTRTGVVKGTPYYMAPEQITGKKVDGRCDIFSLGVVMFQLLTGHLPFMADNPGALMHKIVHAPHPDPKKLTQGLVQPLVTVINNALEKDITKRYQNAWQMAAHLRQIEQKIDTLIAQKKTQSADRE